MAFYSQIDASKKQRIGTRKRDVAQNEYIYLKGASSMTAGTWVTFDENGATTLLAADAVGPVAVAMAAVDASTKYGWFQIYGVNTVAKSDTTAADAALYIDGTAGRVDDATVSGDMVVGAFSQAADVSNVLTVRLVHPFVTNVLG